MATCHQHMEMPYFHPSPHPVFSSSLLVLSFFFPKQLQWLWKLQNLHSPQLFPSSIASFAPKSPAHLHGQHRTGHATWHDHGFLGTELKNILSEQLFSISFESWRVVWADYGQTQETLSPLFHLETI